MEVILHTDGKRGLWNNTARAVRITDMVVGYIDEEFNKAGRPEFGELRVKFDTKTWDTDTDGLIYCDNLFERELREFLKTHGLAGNDVSYSEQGMQGCNFVSCDVGEKFLKSWGEKFAIDWAAYLQKIRATY